jgi:hypothetical protein
MESHEEPWKRKDPEDDEDEDAKTLEVCVGYCYFPTPVRELSKDSKAEYKETHDVKVIECNLYTKYEV